MCGITGWLDWKRDLRGEQQQIEAMTHSLDHRGPDAQTTFVDERVAFGHTRLAVIDPSRGGQPMTRTYKDKTATIVYNGELYNTEEIRQSLLSKGVTFTTHSDTEVLLYAYLVEGETCIERFNGIFAFVIWDGEVLFAARDRLGVKPFFYTTTEHGLIFGSELKAILSHRDTSAVIDEEGLTEVMTLSPSRTPGFGVFKGMKDLRPAHALRFDKNGLRVWRYWQVESKEHTDNVEDTALKVHDLLEDTVNRQLVSDVPVATFLSGGLDSSALTAFAAKQFGENEQLHTFSIDYEDNQTHFKKNDFQPDDDQAFIKLMTQQFGTVHHEKVIKITTLKDMLKNAVKARDLPGMADIDSSLLWFSKEIKKQATVALSGECADEIFGGYPWFYKKELLERPFFPWMSSLDLRQNLLHANWKKQLSLKDYAKLRYDETIKETPELTGENAEEQNRRQMFYLNMIWFMTTLLDRKDRMSMAASLEVRVPFADHRLVEYVWNVPWEMKRYKDREKGLLRKALEGVLPHDVLYRKKSPYPKTHHPDYTEQMVHLSENVLADRNAPIHEIIDYEQYKTLVDSKAKSIDTPFFGQLMSGPQLLAYLWQFNYWLESYNVQIK
ncbi:asparagine synthase (glutamine-hydrolyzing) [Geomicrobium sediminis]|uniref:asparagine synthase (glutamine-hydrolyzing) n=1 Tax=Geomicrobium sediminis TaxID=1347788 RepID=A0ABS2PER2_9BACL|nr:asparagine synthase (glutamine-hydrolyzing) [Geomicrobium sediminis]MBM7633616.1 asparagine synthase (glutamine-hydrolyzing) [Geomicrobium sediminis]